jgi:hypothetical protein
MPGWVQGLGQTAAQLNPTVDQLAARKLAVMGQGAQIAERGMAMGIAQQKIAGEEADRRLAKSTDAEKQRQKLIKEQYDNTAQAIMQGPGMIDGKVLGENLKQAGATPEEAATLLRQLKLLSENVSTKFNLGREDVKAREEADRKSLELREKQFGLAMSAFTQKATAKSEEDQAIEIAAKDIASGGLSTLRDVAGFRGTQRLKLFARIKELDPKFSTAELNRKIDMEKLFTTGVEGRNVASFDTYWQHSGNVLDVLDKFYQSGSPAFNKPMNWIRKNAAGDPNLQRFIVAIEPVKKEFELFLLNNRALYVEDRKEAAEFMDKNTGPEQMRAALEQMGKTAQDRFVAKNHQYKRVVGHDLENPISPEGIASAKRIGVAAGPPTAGLAGQATKPAMAPVVNVTEEELKKLGFK